MSFTKHLLPAWKRILTTRSEVNASILRALDTELKQAEKDTIEGKVVMSLETSTGKWLDQYGDIFGVIRKDEEEDDTYRSRIIEYVKLQRGTIPAIIKAIREFLQDFDSHIEIYEPHTNIFYLNKSKLNGEDHLLGEYYTFAVIDVRFSKPFPVGILDVINDFKPAGVKVHLTFRPGTHNIDAPIVEMPLENSEVHRTSTKLTIMNGMDDQLRGHLTLSKSSRDSEDTSNLFKTNKSKLNSLDRLAGSLSASRGYYNLVGYSEENITIKEDTTIESLFKDTEQVTPDVYTRTDKINDQYAEIEVGNTRVTYIYTVFDVFMFLDMEYNRYLKEFEPSGSYDSKTFGTIMGDTTIQYQVGAMVEPSREIIATIEVFDFKSKKWVAIGSNRLTPEEIGGVLRVPTITEKVTNSGLVFTRMKLTQNATSRRRYNIRLHFYELGFKKDVGVRPTIRGYVNEVRGVGSTHLITNTNNIVETESMINGDDDFKEVKGNILGTRLED